MHGTLIFTNLHKNDTKKHGKTESTLSRETLRFIPEFEENEVYFNIE